MQTQHSPTVSCIVMHSSLPSGRASGNLHISGPRLIASYEGKDLVLPLRGLDAKWGGANDKLIFFSHPTLGDWNVYTRDRSIITQLRQVADPDLTEKLKALSRDNRKRHRVALYVVIALVALVWGILALRNPVVSLVAKIIPPSWERALGEAVYAGVRAQTPILDDSDLTKDLEKLVQPLTTVLKDSPYKFNFYISREEDLNAFALPGGIIVVNAGTILKSERPEEVLGVLAHEVSHVTLRHTTRQAISVFGLYLVVDLLFGNVFGTVAAVSQGATYLLQQGFSREHEHEADASGLALLYDANVDPSGMVRFFERLKQEYENIPLGTVIEGSLSFLNTHPATNERIAYLKERIQSTGSKPFVTLSTAEFEDFKTRLRKKLS